MSKRKKVSQHLRDRLLLECGLKCPVPKCGREVGLDVHHINKDPEDNSPSNLLILCAIHHRAAHEGSLSQKMCRTLKDLLQRESYFDNSAIIHLKNRHDYLACAINELKKVRSSYRCIYVGPLFLHPEWYFKRRNRLVYLPNFDRVVYKFVHGISRENRCAYRFIFRNTPRYRNKVDEVISKRQRRKFIGDTLKRFDELWGKTGRKGPLFTCINTGFLRIPIIHDDSSLLVASRKSTGSPISGGLLYKHKADIAREQIMFDQIFENSHEGMKKEIAHLKEFILNLWT